VRLIRDGKKIAEAGGQLAVVTPAKGVYRVEAYVPGSALPWILSNPIYVVGEGEAAARAARAAWPPAPEPAAPAQTIEDFEKTPSFAPEFDSSSRIDPELLVPKAGPDRSRAARMAFRLGEPGPGRPHTWCALVDRTRRDLSSRSGLVLSLKGDGVYRIWVQARDENPASADEGQEIWFASLKTSTGWRRVAVPFARLRSIDPKTDGRLDLDKLRALVFVLDRGAVKPGTSGTIWIDDVGVY
jgi:hypothetical protein